MAIRCEKMSFGLLCSIKIYIFRWFTFFIDCRSYSKVNKSFVFSRVANESATIYLAIFLKFNKLFRPIRSRWYWSRFAALLRPGFFYKWIKYRVLKLFLCIIKVFDGPSGYNETFFKYHVARLRYALIFRPIAIHCSFSHSCTTSNVTWL